MAEGFTEPHLTEMLDFIAGRGKWRHAGKGIASYPSGNDNHRAIHAICEELERRGMIYRHRDESPDAVLWRPTEAAINSADYLTGFPPGTVERGEWQVERDADGSYRCTLPLTFRPAGESPSAADDDDREWPLGATDTFEGECERCGEVKPLQSVADPFATERITDEDPAARHAWCRPCWELRAGDV